MAAKDGQTDGQGATCNAASGEDRI